VDVGILSIKDDFSDDLVRTINKKGGSAEIFTLKEIEASEPSPHRVILDRLSYLDKFARTYLKTVALSGTYVINNPFTDSADDKFFEYSLAKRLGVRIPRTILLPPLESEYDLGDTIHLPSWEEVIEKIGFPAILKPFDGYAWRNVFRVHSREELEKIYQEHDEVFVLQEYIEYDHYVRAFVIGKKEVLAAKYDPVARSLIWHPKHLTPDEGREIIDFCIKLNRALDYDFNTVEFALKSGKAYAIDFWNTVPEVEPRDMPQEYYFWVIDKLSNFILVSSFHPHQTRYIWGFMEHTV